MSVLEETICGEDEEFDLRSTDFFRPPLKQIGNSIYEIKQHYLSNDVINIIPQMVPTHLAKIRDSLLRFLQDDSFLYKNNIITGSAIETTTAKYKNSPSLMALMDCLALAMDFEVSPRPRDVQCDILLAICGQPVIVLTMLDGDRDSETVTAYNTSVARGVTTTLRKFMDESIYVVCGVLCQKDLDDVDTFKSLIESFAEESSLLVTRTTLATNPSKYEKIVTAFWAGVAETRSVISREGRVETDYLKFLTKDQCIILMENINNREVAVQSQHGSGATTLMLEVTRRLSRLDKTLLVCRSREEKARLKTVYPNTVCPEDLSKTDLASFQHVIDETGTVKSKSYGRFWKFSSDTKCSIFLENIKNISASTKYKLAPVKNNIQFLKGKICAEREREFDLRSTNFFRPPLKQIGNSIYEIKSHYMSQGPVKCPSHLIGIRDMLFKHLEGESFLYERNILTGLTLEPNRDKEEGFPCLLVLVDCLALAMDFEVSHRPYNVQCDILLAVCGQPVIVLTLVDGDKDSETVTAYNTSVARGVTTTLRKFMDESIYVVCGVLSQKDMDDVDTFKSLIESFAEESSLFVTLTTLATNPSKYEKIVTAFWAGVAETRSVISRDGRVDSDYLRFLTKDQCIILMENINNREVEVQSQPDTGATTLMLEVTRRLSRLDRTLLVCRSQEEKARLESVYPDIITLAELRITDMSKYTNIVDDTGTVTGHVSGKLWSFRKVYSEIDALRNSLEMIEKEYTYTEKMIHLLSSADRRDKLNHLSRETEILMLLDSNFQGLLSAYHLPSCLALDVKPVKQNSAIGGDRDRRLETEDYVRHVLDQLKHGIRGRRDLFPLLGDMVKQVKSVLPYLQAKTDYLKLATPDELLTEVKENQTGVPADKDLACVEHQTPLEQSRREMYQPNLHILSWVMSPLVKFTEWIFLHYFLPVVKKVKGILSFQEKQTDDQKLEGEPGVTQDMKDDMNEVTDSENIEKLKTKLEILKTEADHKKQELNLVRGGTDNGVEWEYNMDCLSQTMADLKIQDIITDVIGEDVIPVSADIQSEPIAVLGGDRGTGRRAIRCQIYQLMKLQHGTLKQTELFDIVGDVMTDDQSRLTNLRTQSDRLERAYGSPIHIIGAIDTENSGPVSCPPMTFNRKRVNELLAVSEDGLELVNRMGRSLDHRTDPFKKYIGTSSLLPIPLPPPHSTPTAATYWETHTRLQVEKDVLGFDLLEMAVCQEGAVDTGGLVSVQSSSSWGLVVEGCYKHWGHVCTKVCENGRQVGECLTGTMSPTPGTDVTLKYGITLDVGRGRLAFIDVNRGRVLHKFHVNFRESLSPMFSVSPLPDHVHATMKLISGREVAMTGEKQQLIVQALFCK